MRFTLSQNLRPFLAIWTLCLGACFGHSQTVTITMQTSPGTPISPLIYGANFADQSQATALNLPVNRSGGNATTRYNWVDDSTSSGADWYFLSHPNGNGTPSGSVDSWITGNRNAHTKSMVTIPLIGWVAKLLNGGYNWSFSVAKYGAQQAVEPWHSDCGNGKHTDGTNITGNDPNDANMPVAISYQQNWLNHIIERFGTAAGNGVSYYLLDNEPSIWQENHRDVLPVGVTMSDLFNREVAAARMVKNLDPAAQVCGPEEWGWLGYLHSGYDLQWHGINGWGGTAPDRAAHGGMDCSPWLLQQFAAASAAEGRRLLDVFSLHYYPQSIYGGGDTSAAATAWRSRCTRSLWDPNYVDESWIGDKINLIPRMHNWVNTYYPGTKLGVTEYNFGDDNTISSALAQADVLGILGREQVDLATRWVCPSTNSLCFKAMQLFRNYDGANSTFGDVSLPISGSNPDTLATFASKNSVTGEYKVLFIHKRTSTSANVKLVVNGLSSLAKASVYQLSSTGLTRLPNIAAIKPYYTLSLPTQTATLLVFRPILKNPSR